MELMGLLALAAAAASSVVPSSTMDRTGQWWIRFSAPISDLNEDTAQAVAKIPLSLDAFPGSSLIICSTKSVAELGAARRANVTEALTKVGIPSDRIHDAGECGLEGDSQSFDHAESVLIIMQRVG